MDTRSQTQCNVDGAKYWYQKKQLMMVHVRVRRGTIARLGFTGKSLTPLPLSLSLSLPRPHSLPLPPSPQTFTLAWVRQCIGCRSEVIINETVFAETFIGEKKQQTNFLSVAKKSGKRVDPENWCPEQKQFEISGFSLTESPEQNLSDLSSRVGFDAN